MLSQNLTDIEGLLNRANAMGIEIFLEDDELIVETSEDEEIEEEFWDELKNSKSQLVTYLKNNSPAQKSQPIIKNVIPVSQYASQIPLSYSQESLWFIDRLEGSTHYHIPAILRLHGQVNHVALELALQTIVNRHEVLRSVIREKDGIAYQQVLKADQWKLSIFNKGAELNQEILVNEFIGLPFDLSADAMLRAGLFQVTADEELLVIVLHHIASDGWSLSIIVKELSVLYDAYINDTIPDLAPMAIQYADYAIWQKTYVSGDLLDRQQAYWKKQLAGLEPLQLTTDFARPAIQSNRGAVIEKVFSKELSEQLNELSRKQDVTLFMTLLTAFQVLLHRHSGQDDICVGTPIAGRLRREVEDLVGYFINTLAIRSDLSETPSFTALLKQVKNTLLDSYDHQDIPFEKIVDVIVKERDMSRGPLFQVMFVLQNTPDSSLSLGDLQVSIEEPDYTTAKFDLTFNCVKMSRDYLYQQNIVQTFLKRKRY